MALSLNIGWKKWIQRLQNKITYTSQSSPIESKDSWDTDLKTGLDRSLEHVLIRPK